MARYRIDPETGALIFAPNTEGKIKELEEKANENKEIIEKLLARIEKLEGLNDRKEE